MPYVTVGRENTGDIAIYYQHHGTGAPVVLVHGYLADGRSWEKQEAALLAAGYRVITYDRRGGGASSRPSAGYDYDRLAADLNVLLEELNLRDAVLAGCGSGTGEVTRYLATYGQRRVRATALGCAVAWREDFRADVARITVPALIVQGAQDRVMPPGATGNRLAVLLADARLAVVPEGPHAIIWTHAAEVNRALVGFLHALLRAPR